MRKRPVAGLSPASGQAVDAGYEMIEFLNHVQGAVADNLYDTGNTGLLGASIDVNGTTTNYWANAGYWTPAGDHAYVTTNAEVKKFFNLSVLGERGLCMGIFFQMYFTAAGALSAAESVLDVGRNSTTNGWELVFNTTRVFTIGYREEGGASLVNKINLNLSSLNNVRSTVGFFIDTQASPPRTYGITNGDETTIQSDDLALPLPSIASTQGVNFFARGGSSTAKLGAGGSGIRIGDVRFVHIPGGSVDAYIKWLEIAKEMTARPFEPKLKALTS